MIDDRLDQGRGHLDLADAGLGLRVRDAEAGAVRVVQAYVADPHGAQLAGSHPGPAEGLADDPSTRVPAANHPRAQPLGVEGHRRPRQVQTLGDLCGTQAARQQARHRSCRLTRLLIRRDVQQAVLLRRGGEQRGQFVDLEEAPARFGDVDLHPATAGRVRRDVAVLDRLVQDRSQDVAQLGPCGGSAPASSASAGAAVELVQHDPHPLAPKPHARVPSESVWVWIVPVVGRAIVTCPLLVTRMAAA